MTLRSAQTWMLALGGWGALTSMPVGAEEKLATPEQAQDPDLAFLRRLLRSLGTLPQAPTPLVRLAPVEPPPALPPETAETLARLARKDADRAHAWRTLEAFLNTTLKGNDEREAENTMTRKAFISKQAPLRNLAPWRQRASALMSLARSGRLAEDVYQEARRALEEELRKALAQTEVDGAKPFPRTVEETAQLVLTLLEPDLKDPKTQPSPLREEIAGLIARLGDSDFQAREAATQRLRAIGEPALGALREVLKEKDPEVSDRARSLWSLILEDSAGPPGRKP